MKDCEKRSSVVRTVIITLSVIAAIAAIAAVLYKYFKISFDCGDCDDCTAGCFDSDFDPMSDEDFAPECALDDEDEDEDGAKA